MRYKRSQIKVFSRDWFEINQPILLFILNNPFAYKIRELIGINKIEPIYKLTPNAVHFKLDKEYYKAEFYTRAVFADMLHKNFESVWRTLHNIDMFLKLIKLRRINFGFDTLTVYPDPHPEVNTVDGYTYPDATEMLWADKRNQGGGGSNDSLIYSGHILRIDTKTTSGYYSNIFRAHFLFDTSSLGSDVNITSSEFSFVCAYKQSTFASCDRDFHLCSTNPASNTELVPDDHQTVGDISFGSIGFNSVVVGRNYIALNSNGLAAISKTGISKFGARMGADINNIEPTWGVNKLAYYTGYYTENSANKPRLDVTYQPSTSIKSLLGVDYSDVKSVLGIDKNNIKSILGIE